MGQPTTTGTTRPSPRADLRGARLRLADALDLHRDEIAAAWYGSVAQDPRVRFPELERYLRSLVSGLYEVFRDNQWTLTQTIIDGLAERRARTGASVEHGVQRALLAGRHAIKPFYATNGSVDPCDDILLDALHECLFRFSESYQGVRMSTENDRLHTRIIRSLVMALEARDPYTKGHSISVALLAQRLAQVVGWKTESHLVYLAGLLHDVGKVGIPDSVLLKPGPLSTHEWEVMRSHPALGASILKPIKLYPEVLAAVLSHHENLDGTGYPQGLVGDEIHPIARVIRVADSFDAMTSTRSHRAARSVDETLDVLVSERGSVYQPDIVEALAEMVHEPDAMRDLGLASLQIDLQDFDDGEIALDKNQR
ncbi:MAG: HD-GYP domain-containing protein [Actinomycetota bacterium]|nr:HD-GYP domain-containing protein [Actinomycetota bacterium]